MNKYKFQFDFGPAFPSFNFKCMKNKLGQYNLKVFQDDFNFQKYLYVSLLPTTIVHHHSNSKYAKFKSVLILMNCESHMQGCSTEQS